MTSQSSTEKEDIKCFICGHHADETFDMGKVALFETLEHLSYIMECILVEANGEAKFELDQLGKSLKDKFANNYISKELLERFEEASSSFQTGDRRSGRGKISSLSRSLWISLMNQKPATE